MRDKVSQVTLALANAYTDAHGGGGGGTSNYNDLSHLPTVNGVEFKGTMTGETLGLVNSEDLGDLATKDSASGTTTPAGSVSVTEHTLVVEGTKLKLVTGSASASFSGTQATISVS